MDFGRLSPRGYGHGPTYCAIPSTRQNSSRLFESTIGYVMWRGVYGRVWGVHVQRRTELFTPIFTRTRFGAKNERAKRTADNARYEPQNMVRARTKPVKYSDTCR